MTERLIGAETILLTAWKRGAPGADTSHGFPRGFWPDVARAAVEMALMGNLHAPLSFVQTTCSRGDWPERERTVKGIDLNKLEFTL